MTFPPYGKPRDGGKTAVPPYRNLREAGKTALLPYVFSSGFFGRFRPRNGWMLKAASCSLSAP
jgi:hypothetical protein